MLEWENEHAVWLERRRIEINAYVSRKMAQSFLGLAIGSFVFFGFCKLFLRVL